MKLLIGNTGVIGKTLKDRIVFDYEFNSKNIHELLNLQIDPTNTDIYLCCLPATKWMVNKDPQIDLNNIFEIINILTKKEYRNIILYSTIDVYNNVPLNSDESYPLQISTPDYGSNRLLFEKLVSTTLKYEHLLIFRLPALFGKYIKKNILFDLLNNNEIHKIDHNSKYQWYNLEDLVNDTFNCLNELRSKLMIINLFSEPIATSDILKLFDIKESKADTKSKKIVYDFKTNTNITGYVKNQDQILLEIKKFIFDYKLITTKLAVCIFGEPRNILSKIEDWKRFISCVPGTDFYFALYSNEDIFDIVQTINLSLPVKSFFITNNNLDYFDKLKHKAKHPIYIYKIDPKATFARITSQAFIRQKSISLVELQDYDAILLCRSDISNFSISSLDIFNVTQNPDLLIVNSDSHVHPGGGSGCTKCNMDSKCSLEHHANDICDYWCIGSPKVMDKWNYFYDNLLEDYYNIQQSSLDLKDVSDISYEENPNENEISIYLTTYDFNISEYKIHCYYPEKIMRSTFKDIKVLGATNNDKTLWML